MSASIFNSKTTPPDHEMLEQALGEATHWLDQIIWFINENIGPLRQEWKYYGQKSGWVLKLINQKRNLLFVVPQKDSFRVVFTFGEKAFQQIIHADIAHSIRSALLQATVNTEGRTIQITLNDELLLTDIMQLIFIKHNPEQK